ncbi:MAG: hypothetical protein HZB51_34845 [Chloroflexi bacterium]|nr:hypothetical protein [Chloroflexota bacterium]
MLEAGNWMLEVGVGSTPAGVVLADVQAVRKTMNKAMDNFDMMVQV